MVKTILIVLLLLLATEEGLEKTETRWQEELYNISIINHIDVHRLLLPFLWNFIFVFLKYAE